MDKQRVMQKQEIEQLRQSAQCVLDFHKELSDTRRDLIPMTLFRAVAALTLQIAEPGVELRDIRFTPKELLEKVTEIGFLKKLPKESDTSDWVLKHWNNLEKEIEQRKGHLQEVASRHKMEFYPWIDKEESNGGPTNHSLYYLAAKSFADQEIIDNKQYPCPAGGLHYVPESLSSIPIWARWVSGLVLRGWQKYAFLLPVMVVALLGLFIFNTLLFQGIHGEISAVSWLSQALVVAGLAVWVYSAPLYRVVIHRIVMAPVWMTPMKETNVQLELKKTGTDSETGQAIRELRLMVYSAKCPVCSARIEVESGGFEFPFRLVGRCIESPREHVFSFDHVTKTGKPLRVS
jgi:hypothetical protein